MNRFAWLLVLLCLGLFTIGCGSPEGGAVNPEDTGMEDMEGMDDIEMGGMEGDMEGDDGEEGTEEAEQEAETGESQ